MSPPCYVRKVDRAGHWGTDEEDRSIRVKRIIEKVFPCENGLLSVYLVNNADDLLHVAVAFNANRSQTAEEIRFIAIGRDELPNNPVVATSGDTACLLANRLHRDVRVDNPSTLEQLVATLLERHRQPKKYSKKVMTEAKRCAEADGCHAVKPNSTLCVCENQFGLHRWWSMMKVSGESLYRWVCRWIG